MDTTPTPEEQEAAAAVRLAKLVRWDSVKAQLATLKALEMDLRKECTAEYFPDPKAGTQREALAEGYALKLVAKQNYTLDPDLDAIDKVQDAIEKVGNEGAFIAGRLFKWSVELSVTEYKSLDATTPTGAAIKKLVDTVLTTSWGAPTLEIEAPKAPKAKA